MLFGSVEIRARKGFKTALLLKRTRRFVESLIIQKGIVRNKDHPHACMYFMQFFIFVPVVTSFLLGFPRIYDTAGLQSA